MFTEAQAIYLEEVLGSRMHGYAVPTQPQVVVLSPPLVPEDLALLGKILASIGLNSYRLMENWGPEVDGNGKHVLAFLGEPSGRQERDGAIWWNMPSVASMQGSGPEVAAYKKEAWNWLQRFRQECPQ